MPLDISSLLMEWVRHGLRRFFLRAAARPTQRALFWMALISVSPPRFLQYLLTAVLLFA
jgi:hypothetical protein